MAKKQTIGYAVFDGDSEKLIQTFEDKADAAALHNRLLGVTGQGPTGSGDGPERDLHVVEIEAA